MRKRFEKLHNFSHTHTMHMTINRGERRTSTQTGGIGGCGREKKWKLCELPWAKKTHIRVHDYMHHRDGMGVGGRYSFSHSSKF